MGMLTVLNIGGVLIGSLASNMMAASASITARLLTSPAYIENVTNPWPVVPLLGGRNPILGSDGASPKRRYKLTVGLFYSKTFRLETNRLKH